MNKKGNKKMCIDHIPITIVIN